MLGEPPALAREQKGIENYSAITRMIAPVTKSERHDDDLKEVFNYYLNHILAEIRRRRELDGLELGHSDLHASIHSNYLLGTKSLEPAKRPVPYCTIVEACVPEEPVHDTQPLPWVHDPDSENRAGFVSFAITFGQALLFQDLGSDDEGAEEWRRLFRQVALSNTAAVVVAPIFLEEGKLWGALNLESTKSGAFRQEDMFFLLICIRLLAVQIEQFLESRRSENQTLLLNSLSQASGAKHQISTATKVAQLMCEQFRADQVIISPRCRTLWPIFEPVVSPPIDELPYTIRKTGYTHWLTDHSYEDRVDGLWVTRTPEDKEPLKVRKFWVSEAAKEELLGQEDIEAKGCSWEINSEDTGFNTLVGLAVPLDIEPDTSSGAKAISDTDAGSAPGSAYQKSDEPPKRSIGAVVWVKNKMTIPYSSIRASELAHMAKWLEAFLNLHRDFNTDRSFEVPVFSRTALESYLQRAKDQPSKNTCPHLMALLDIDNFRWVNAMCGYAEGTRIIKEVVRSMTAAAHEVVERLDKDLGHDKNVYFDVYRYGGDEFVLLGRLGRAKDPEDAKMDVFQHFEEWDRITREKLKTVPIRPQKKDAAAKKGVAYSLGVTKDLPRLIREIGGDEEDDCTEKLVRYLGACIRIAKKGQGAVEKTVVFEDVYRLVMQSLPETREDAPDRLKIAKVLVPNQLVVINAGEQDNVRQGMRFQVLHDNTLGEDQGLFTDGQDLPKADLEITEVWSKHAQAKASRVAGTIERGDRVIIRLD